MAQALVPLKDLVEAKSRLAGLLKPSERRALAQAMVEDVLAVLSQHSAISRVVLLSDDPCAGLLANQYGIQCWPEHSLGCSGLNPLITSASERLLAESDEPLLVLHGDLPLLGPEDITAVLSLQYALQGLVIGCDRAGSGTNLLAFDGNAMPHFQFGPNSCRRHAESATDQGHCVQTVERAGLALDIDEPADLQVLLRALRQQLSPVVGDVIPKMPHDGASWSRARHTADLLYGTALGSRIELALATLDGASDGGSKSDGQFGLSLDLQSGEVQTS